MRSSRATSGGRLVRDRGRPRERRSHGHRRAARRRGADSKTRFGTPVELATGSRKTYILYAQPPVVRRQHQGPARGRRQGRRGGAGRDRRSTTRRSSSSASSPRTRPRSSASSTCLPNQNGVAPGIATLTPGRPARADPGVGAARPADLAGHGRRDAHAAPSSRRCGAGSPAADAWSSSAARPGADTLAAFPDELLPYRPTAVLDVDPAVAAPGPRRRCPRAPRRSPAYAGDPGAGRTLATSGDRVIAAEPQVRRRVRHPARLRPDDVLDRRRATRWTCRCGDAPAAALGRHGVALGRLDRSSRGLQPAEPRAAADRRPARAAVRLHRARRPGELPRPAPARPARVGVGHRPGAHRRVHDRLRSGSARCCAARTSSSTRSRSSAARRAPTRRRAGVPRHLQPRRARRSSSGRRRRTARDADERRHLRRRHRAPASTCSRATRRASATSRSGSGRCARSGPRAAPRARSSTADAPARRRPDQRDGHNHSDRTLESPALVLGSVGRQARRHPGRREPSTSTSPSRRTELRHPALGARRRAR